MMLGNKFLLSVFGLILILIACNKNDYETSEELRRSQMREKDEFFYSYGLSPIGCSETYMQQARVCLGTHLGDISCVTLFFDDKYALYSKTIYHPEQADTIIRISTNEDQSRILFDSLSIMMAVKNNSFESFIPSEMKKYDTWTPFYVGSLETCINQRNNVILFATDSLHLIPPEVKKIIELAPDNMLEVIEQ